jgi:hypothetical protein
VDPRRSSLPHIQGHPNVPLQQVGVRGILVEGALAAHLNPLDYFVWSAVEKKACAVYHSNVDALKASVEKEWNNLSAATLKKVCKKFRSRLEACIAAEGGIFEK